MNLTSIIWLALLVVVLRFGVPWLLESLKRQRLATSGIADIDQMDGRTFEQYLHTLFSKLGYRVELTRYVGDYGADLITCKNGVKTVVQAKRYKNAVGIKAVQEAVAAKGMYGCTEAMVVTNSAFTKQAVELARANRVVLWDRERLIDALLSVAKTAAETNRTDDVTIPATTPAPMPIPAAAHSQISPQVVRLPAERTCAACGKAVSEDVAQFCLDRPEKFAGRLYCFAHQRTLPAMSSSPVNSDRR